MSHLLRMFINDEDTRWVRVHWGWHAFMGIWRFFSRSRTHPVLELSQQMMMLAMTTRKERRRGGKGNADSATLIFLPIPISGQNIKSIHHLNSVLCSVFVSNHFAWFDQLISIPNRAWQVRLGLQIYPKLIYFCINSNLFRLQIYLVLFWLVSRANHSLDWYIIARASISRSLQQQQCNG